jgi:hypothetical protein
MSEETPNQGREDAPRPSGSGGVGFESQRDVNVGGDIAGRDVVSSTTNVGFGPREVQRLIVTVGAIVFITAGCFFSGGLAVGGVAFAALNTQVNSDDPAAAVSFQAKLQQLRALPPGQSFVFPFTEKEISAYFRQALAPQMGVTNGKIRLIGDRQLVVGGQGGVLGNLPFAATFELQNTPGAPLRLRAAAVQILRLENSSFGWVFVPTALLQPLEDNLNSLFSNVQITQVVQTAVAPNPAWTVGGVAH